MKNVKIELFYANWCGHCKIFHPHFEDLKDFVNKNKDMLKKNYDVEIEVKDYEEEANKEMFDEKGIMAFPTIMIDGEVFEGKHDVAVILKEVVPGIKGPEFEDFEKRAKVTEEDEPEKPEPKMTGEMEVEEMKEMKEIESLDGGNKDSYFAKYIMYKKMYLKLMKA